MKNGVGVQVSAEGARFQLWAPKPKCVELFFPDAQRTVKMDRAGEYWTALVEGVGAGTKYFYRLDSELDRGDPASRCQPDVHGPSEIISNEFQWTDETWGGIPLEEHVLYELHVGTFTSEGTFEAIIPHLKRLKELGITTLELMPIAQFPGTRNWGYDGVFPYAVQTSYGGLHGLKTLVNAAHGEGMAVVLDVVYNHLGPEGNYLADFGPYFTEVYETPWGQAVNFDEEYSDAVRDFFSGNVEYWLEECHLDGLRLDACHEIFDASATHILEEMQSRVDEISARCTRQIHLFAESDANDPRYIKPRDVGGYGLSCQWLDDYHHSVYTILNGADSALYIKDYYSTDHFAKGYVEGFVYSGQYCPTRKRRHGRTSDGINGSKFVVFIQNHDQIGNRPSGKRLIEEVSFEAIKLAAGTIILSPYIPMFFMGEEYGETAPFLFFTDHSDPELIKGMKEGREEEFAAATEVGELADPQALDTFSKSVLNHGLADNPRGKIIQDYIKSLLRLRRDQPALCCLSKENIVLHSVEPDCVVIERKHPSEASSLLVVFNFGKEAVEADLPQGGDCKVLFESGHEKWRLPTAPIAEAAEKRQNLISAESFKVYNRG